MPRWVLGVLILVCAALAAVGILLVADSDAPPTSAEQPADPPRPTAYTVFLRGPVADHGQLAERFEALPGAIDVEYVSKEEAVEVLADKLENVDLSDSIRELNGNPLPAAYRVVLDPPVADSEARSLFIAAAGPDSTLIDQVSAADNLSD